MLRGIEKVQPMVKEKKDEKLVEAFVLWEKKSKNNTFYLTGVTSTACDEVKRLIAFYNGSKKNPKEPDIRVYSVDAAGKQDTEVAGLWNNVSKNEKEYLTGVSGDKEKLIGFYAAEKGNMKRPDIRVYFREEK